MKSPIIFLIWFAPLLLLTACKKSAFLSAKPGSNLVVPTTLQDFVQALDNPDVMAETGALGILSSDEFFLSPAFWTTLPVKERNAYTWSPDVYEGQGAVVDWNYPYQQVFYANVVLDGLSKIDRAANPSTYDFVKGWALFARAYAFYNVVSVFAPTYDAGTAETDPGVPLKLDPLVTNLEPRATVQDTYDRVLADLYQSESLLPVGIATENRNRPSRPAAAALLARIYLAMGEYDKAGTAADSSLAFYSKLIDYNTGSVYGNRNDETLLQSSTTRSSSAIFYLQFGNVSLVDTVLFSFYQPGDLRATLFYRDDGDGLGYQNLIGTYEGFGNIFTGLTTAECLLIRAESSARAGNTASAMADLNHLLINRYSTGTFVMQTASGPEDALAQVLTERRKELAFRGVRFTDIRRLNKEGYGISLTRVLGGQTYHLAPNSPLYVLPIPPDEIALSGIQQNPR